MSINYYKVLDILPTTSEDDIKKAYKKMALKYHPDKNQNDPISANKFKEISEAYQGLINKKSIPSYNDNMNKFINPNDLFGQLFGNQQFMDKNIAINTNYSNFFGTVNRTSGPPTNNSYTYKSTQIINGKKIEKIVERINGATRKRTIITNL